MVDYRNLCQKAGKSVEGTWKRCGVGRTTFFSWMNGTSQPNEEQAELFADYVNEDASKLFPDICQID